MSPKPSADPLAEVVRAAVEFPVRGQRVRGEKHVAQRARSARSQALLEESRRIMEGFEELVRRGRGASKAALYRDAAREYLERHPVEPPA